MKESGAPCCRPCLTPTTGGAIPYAPPPLLPLECAESWTLSWLERPTEDPPRDVCTLHCRDGVFLQPPTLSTEVPLSRDLVALYVCRVLLCACSAMLQLLHKRFLLWTPAPLRHILVHRTCRGFNCHNLHCAPPRQAHQHPLCCN